MARDVERHWENAERAGRDRGVYVGGLSKGDLLGDLSGRRVEDVTEALARTFVRFAVHPVGKYRLLQTVSHDRKYLK